MLVPVQVQLINLYLSVPTQENRTRARGRGEHLCNSTQKKWLILKEQCALFTQLQAAPSSPPHLSPAFCPSLLPPPASLPPSLHSPAPAERLTRADEKGSSVKGQR